MFDLFLIMWLADIVDSFIGFSVAGSIVSVLAGGFLACIAMDECEKEKARRCIWRGGLAALVLITVAILLPSKRTIHLYAAGTVGQEIAATPLAQKAYQAADAVLDKIISEAQPTKEK